MVLMQGREMELGGYYMNPLLFLEEVVRNFFFFGSKKTKEAHDWTKQTGLIMAQDPLIF